MSIPSFSQVVEWRRGALLSREAGQTRMDVRVSDALDTVRSDFLQAHRGTFINPHQALDYVHQRLPDLTIPEQAAIARQLVEDVDRTVRWPAPGNTYTLGLTGEPLRVRQEGVEEVLTEFIRNARAESLGVDDLVRALRLKPPPDRQINEGGFLWGSGPQTMTFTPMPPLAAHLPLQTREEAVQLGVARREGHELEFIGWIPQENGYVQVRARIDAENSEGPLTPRERAALDTLGAKLSEELGRTLIPPENFGSIGSLGRDGILGRVFDQRRALTNGSYVYMPQGEGPITQIRQNDRPQYSQFSIGPVHITVEHNPRQRPKGETWTTVETNGTHFLTLEAGLRNGDTVRMQSTQPQPSAEIDSQRASFHDLLRAIFQDLALESR